MTLSMTTLHIKGFYETHSISDTAQQHCQCAECEFFIIILCVVMLNVLMLSVVMLNVVIVNVIMLKVFMVNVFMLNVVMLTRL